MTARELIATIRTMLSPQQRLRYVRYQAFFAFAGILQILGAGSVAPFVGVLSQPAVLHTNRWVAGALRLVGTTSDLDGIIAFAVAMIVLLILANVTAAVSVWLTYRFSLDVGAEIKDALLDCYLHRDYARLAGTNSSELINRISVGAPKFAFNVMQPLMIVASQGALLFVILAGLALYKPSVLLIFGGLIGGGYVALFFIVRRSLVRHGEYTWSAGERIYRLLVESLGGLKEIRLAGTEDLYRDEHASATRSVYRSEAIIGMLADVPRFLLESVAFSALLILAIVLLRQGNPPATVVGTLTLYAMAGYRMLPAGQAIFKAVSQIRANASILSDLLPDIVEGRATQMLPAPVASSVAIPKYPADLVLRDVWFSYPNSESPVLRGVSTRIPSNSLTVIVGLSGSGKSTLSDLILGLLQPTQGEIEVGGVALHELGRQWFSAVGYVPQSIFLLDDSLEANITFGSRLGLDQARLSRALTRARLDELVNSRSEGVAYRVGERGSRLSGGQRQRVGLARALYHDADFLVLDEATSALDGRTEGEVLDTLLALRRESTVILIAHRLSTIQAADFIVMLDGGMVIAEGTYEELLDRSEHFRTLVRQGDRSDDAAGSVAEVLP